MLQDAFRNLETRVAAMAVREKFEVELWQAFRAWFGWDRPLTRTRRNGHRLYQYRYVHAAAAFLGVNERTVYRSLRRTRPTTAILQGLLMFPYPHWSSLAATTQKRHVAARLKMFRAAAVIRHGDAGKLAADWRRQWLSKAANGKTALELVQGERRKREVA